MMKRLICALALVALALSPACKPTLPVPLVKGPDGKPIEAPPPPKAEDEAAANALAAEAKKLDEAGDTAGATKKRDLLVDSFPGTAAGANELEVRGRRAEDAGDIESAVASYEKLLFYRPSFVRANSVRERYANLLLRVDRFDDAANMLRALFGSSKDPKKREEIGMMLAEALMNTQRSGEALKLYVGVHATAGVSPKSKELCERRSYDIVAAGLAFKQAEALWDDVEGNSDWQFILPALAFKLAKIYYHTRDYDRSEKMLRLVSGRYSDSTFGKQARDFLGRLRNRFRVRPNVIGVLLPLSGRFEQYGNRSLEAIKLAFAKEKTIELVIKDSKSDPRVATKGVEELVLEHHAIAIIGPLFSSESLAAALKAEELSVPLLTLSHREGLPEIGEWVFRTALTVEAQAIALAGVAFDKLGMSRFALLYPRSRYGTAFAHAFWDEVERRKGEIRAVESYEHNQTSFQEPIRKLVGRYYKYSRREYLEPMREVTRLKLPPHRKKMAIEKIEKALAPVTDFDAIVIPDSGRNLGLIAPSLAFEDIVTERDPKMLERIEKATGRKKITPVTLLGGSTWNSMQTLQSCERYCENAVFVDAYYPDSPDPKVRDFVTAFRDAVGTDPDLAEAQAFDTAGVVRWVLTAGGPKDRAAFRKSLLAMGEYHGGTGKMRFDKGGEVRKELLVLTIEKRAIKLWQPTEEPQG